jgi:hypothetical protein
LITEDELGCRTYGICYRDTVPSWFFLRKPHLGAAFFGGRMLLPAGFADGYRSFEEISQPTPDTAAYIILSSEY